MISWLSTVSRFVLCTSTTGVSPVTVIVSCSAPTRISIGIVSTAVPAISMPSRLTVLKPVSANVSEYVPGFRSMMRYWPVPSVTTERTFSINAGLAASTVTPGSTAPDASRTVPVRVPWANTVEGSNVRAASHRKHFTALHMSDVLLEVFHAMPFRKAPAASRGAQGAPAATFRVVRPEKHDPPEQGRGRSAAAIYASAERKSTEIPESPDNGQKNQAIAGRKT